MTAPSCPNCGSASSPCLHVRDYNRATSSQTFNYYRCDACAVQFLSPIPEDMGQYYPSDYHGSSVSREDLARGAEPERYKIDIVKRFVGEGRLVEIGPGGGGFAVLAQDAGFEVSVIEMSQACCDHLTRTLGVEAVCTSDETSALQASDPVDVIALWHVLEHLEDPFTLVRAAARKLVPGGVLVLAAPNPAALQYRILRGRWTHVDAPRHLYLIPPAVLRSVAEESGLRLVLETTMDAGSIGWNRFGWEYSFGNLFKHQRLKRHAMKAGGLATGLMRPFEEQEGRGSAYTMVFERPNP